jgi:hypothetical protein
MIFDGHSLYTNHNATVPDTIVTLSQSRAVGFWKLVHVKRISSTVSVAYANCAISAARKPLFMFLFFDILNIILPQNYINSMNYASKKNNFCPFFWNLDIIL